MFLTVFFPPNKGKRTFGLGEGHVYIEERRGEAHGEGVGWGRGGDEPKRDGKGVLLT